MDEMLPYIKPLKPEDITDPIKANKALIGVSHKQQLIHDTADQIIKYTHGGMCVATRRKCLICKADRCAVKAFKKGRDLWDIIKWRCIDKQEWFNGLNPEIVKETVDLVEKELVNSEI